MRKKKKRTPAPYIRHVPFRKDLAVDMASPAIQLHWLPVEELRDVDAGQRRPHEVLFAREVADDDAPGPRPHLQGDDVHPSAADVRGVGREELVKPVPDHWAPNAGEALLLAEGVGADGERVGELEGLLQRTRGHADTRIVG